MPLTFLQLKQLVRSHVFVSGEARNQRLAHDKSIVDALVDIQRWVDCLQSNNTHLVPHCATFYNCGLTSFDFPRSRIKRLSVINNIAPTQPDGIPAVPTGATTAPKLVEISAVKLGFSAVASDIGKVASGSFTISPAPNTYIKICGATLGSTTGFSMTAVVTITPTDGSVAPVTKTYQSTTGSFNIGTIVGNPVVNGAFSPCDTLLALAAAESYKIDISLTLDGFTGNQSQWIQDGTSAETLIAYWTNKPLSSGPTSFTAPSAAATVPDWCSEIEYQQVEPCHIRRYLSSGASCGCSFPVSEFFAIPRALCGNKSDIPVPTDAGLEAGLPILQLGYHYPQPSTDSPFGRAYAGIWAIENGRVFLAPWIESTETVVVKWEGIKRDWVDADLVDDDPGLIRAIELFLRWEHYRDWEHDPATGSGYEVEYRKALSELIYDCEEENRVRDCEPNHARGIAPTTKLFYNDQRPATETCAGDQSGNPVTVIIPSDSVASTISKQDANDKALAQARDMARLQLNCANDGGGGGGGNSWLNTNSYSELVSCITGWTAGDPPAPQPTGSPVLVEVKAGTVQSTYDQTDANAQATKIFEALKSQALIGKCTFHNREVTITVPCPSGQTHTSGGTETVLAGDPTCDTTVSQAWADNLAKIKATNLANASLVCNATPVPVFWNVLYTTDVIGLPCSYFSGNVGHFCGTIKVQFTVTAHKFSAQTQTDADNQAHAYAQSEAARLAQQLCSIFQGGGPCPTGIHTGIY